MTPALLLLALQGPAAPIAAAPPPVAAPTNPQTPADPPPVSSADPPPPADPPRPANPPPVDPSLHAEPPPATTSTPSLVDPPIAATSTPTSADPPLTPGERASLRRAARRELLLDPQEILQNQWPTAPFCNLDPKGKDACLTLDGELFTGYRRSSLAGNRKFSEFALDRAELGTQFWWRPHWRFDTGVALRVEAIRSAGPNSIIGIDGNSLIMRLHQAYGHGAIHLGPIDIGVRFGQIPERWIEQLEKGYDTRGADPLASDRITLFDRADLGGSLTISGFKGRFDVDVALTNGEGRAQLEFNNGKNTTVIATVRPLRFRHKRGPVALAIHGMYRDGSVGIPPTPLIRNHRAGAAITFQSPWAFGGLEYVRGFGYEARADRVTDTLGAWASAYAYQPWVGLMAKYDHTRQDLAVAGSQVHVVTAAVFSDVFGYMYRNRRRVRLYAGYQYEGYGAAAGPIPGAPAAAETHRFMLQLTAQGLFRVL